MPRSIVITIPSAETPILITEIRQVKGLIGLKLQEDGSLDPPGDIITAEVTNRALNPVMQLLDKHEIGQRKGTSITTSEPTSIVSVSYGKELARDTNEATWEEMEIIAGNESNMTLNVLLMMLLSGVITAIGILTNALHLVIGGMVVAPGYVPISRMSLGLITKSGAIRRGLFDTLKGYLAIMLGAAATMAVYRLFTDLGLAGKSTYLEVGELTKYWTTISVSSVVVSAAAGIIGGLLIATKRSVLTGGVMIALALVPAASLTSMTLVTGNFGLSQKALLRWLIDVGLVIITSYAIFAWKKKEVQKREMIL